MMRIKIIMMTRLVVDSDSCAPKRDYYQVFIINILYVCIYVK